MKQDKEDIIRRRRLFLQTAGAGLIGLMSKSSKSWAASMETLSFGNGERELIAYPQVDADYNTATTFRNPF
jgi:hypothetical protein